MLHGVEETAAEDEAFLDRALQNLDLHLTTIKHKSAYEVAKSMNQGYVYNRAFRVMFLRANKYDPKASADQMILFFEQKNELFGAEKLVKDITLDDLDEGDISCLKAGAVQPVGKDRSGRQVLLYVAGLIAEESHSKRFMKIQFFVVMRALQSEEAQLRGTVSIWYAIGDMKSISSGRSYFELFVSARALPQKKVAIHLCVDDVRTSVLGHAIIKFMQGSMRARVRLHLGSLIECRYAMATYGIPSELIPVDENGGRLLLHYHLQWVQSCTIKDGTENNSRANNKSLEVPAEVTSSSANYDVLFTGAKVSYSEGNKRFLSLIREYTPVYDSGGLEAKKGAVDQIILKIHDAGGRFMWRQAGSNTLWEEVPMADVRKKVTQAFRNHRRQRAIKKPK